MANPPSRPPREGTKNLYLAFQASSFCHILHTLHSLINVFAVVSFLDATKSGGKTEPVSNCITFFFLLRVSRDQSQITLAIATLTLLALITHLEMLSIVLLVDFQGCRFSRVASVTRKIYHPLVNKIRSPKLCNLNLRFQEKKNQIKCKLMHFHFVPPPSSFVLALFTSSLSSSVKLLTFVAMHF